MFHRTFATAEVAGLTKIESKITDSKNTPIERVEASEGLWGPLTELSRSIVS